MGQLLKDTNWPIVHMQDLEVAHESCRQLVSAQCCRWFHNTGELYTFPDANELKVLIVETLMRHH